MSEITELTPELLISAYAQGIFPMGMHGRIAWYSPDPRGILPLDAFYVSKSLAQTARSGRFEIRIDTRFRDVMEACADRPDGTWITPAIVDAYEHLHELGLAHSVEAWKDDQLAGGLYGVALGGAFFGESMFHRQRDASKVALVALVERMREHGFSLLDIQFITPHLERFGAVEIRRDDYLDRLAVAIRQECQFGDE
ncbi:MAG: leucyl/phenylalanyl-tRNA--protein transferase [Phycisphaerales bacterium]|nr:leucyl/phenylalanyl-tRNA--protein transferase [Phycisphaerales bacterium]MCB9854160.1 leucyl/phenylalanyl-tRNA--protein transferase [Phycisphaerales bacterium]MCB9864704.1 leucyl/phenylalanyl-tRNA--protein transferase [Phycisphaerales bacterium]